MNDVNWWLMALAFVLGLLLTLAFMIRRVTREVPIYAALGRGPGVDLPSANLKGNLKVDAPDVDLPDVNLKGAGLAAGAAVAGGAAAAKFSGDAPDIDIAADEPYGAGSVRLRSAGKFGPSGYVVKGNEDSMLYHTTESPSYEQTIAEVWFRDSDSAERAGFARWDSNKGAGLAAGAAAVAGGAVAAKFAGGAADVAADEPYGSGSVRLSSAGRVGPSGYLIKGNEDSMLYHSPESPFYDVTDAEVWFRATEDAEKAGFTRWDLLGGSGTGGGAAKFADLPPGPHGVGSATPGAGGSGPEGWLVKGNEDSGLYHTAESPSYKQTIAEVWFVDEETAQKAGFKRWDVNRKK